MDDNRSNLWGARFPQKPLFQAGTFLSRHNLMARFLASVLLLFGLLQTNSAFAAEFAEGRILVQPRIGLSEERFNKLLKQVGGRSAGKIRGLDVHIVEVAPQAEDAVVRALRHNPNIQFAEPDELLPPVETIPNDPKYPLAWHLQTIGAPIAWDKSSGSGVTVAVLDSGVDSFHLDLASNMEPGWNSSSNNTDTSDVAGHGTKVAGVVAAETDNALGVASVAWQSRIMPVRVTDRSDGWAYFSHIAGGLTWAADHGARVANISFDVSGSASVRSAAQYMKERNGVVVVAAGNSGSDPGHQSSDAMIAVSATRSDDSPASFTSYGNYVDVAAPGQSIWTTANGGGYSSVSGTSFSSPTTAGVASLIMAAGDSLSADEVAAILFNTAVDLGEPGWDPVYGYGRIDAAAAVEMASLGVVRDFEKPEVSIVAPGDGAEVAGLVLIDVNATDNLGVIRVEVLANGISIGTDNTPPYSFVWDTTNAAEGIAIILARAWDAAENRGSSSMLSVQVANADNDVEPPEITITSPAEGETISGNVSLSAYAVDNFEVTELRVLVDGALKCAGTSSVTCSWSTRKKDAGAHVVTSTAVDGAGNTASASVSITVECCTKGGGNDGGGKGGGRGGGKGSGKPDG